MPAHKDNGQPPHVLRQPANWQNLHFYRKSDILYQLTCLFCRRFLPHHGDRTVDQMVQAARSCKQNIVEGSEDGATSTEMELKLLNVARSSNDELREDYEDFIKRHQLPLWNKEHPRFQPMQNYTHTHEKLDDYRPFAEKWTAEVFANTCLTLCYQVDTMINRYLKHLEKTFVEEGGIKERMYAARTGYRKQQDEKMKNLETENAQLKKQVALLTDELTQLQARYDTLRSRALIAYNRQQEEIRQLKEKIP